MDGSGRCLIIRPAAVGWRNREAARGAAQALKSAFALRTHAIDIQSAVERDRTVKAPAERFAEIADRTATDFLATQGHEAVDLKRLGRLLKREIKSWGTDASAKMKAIADGKGRQDVFFAHASGAGISAANAYVAGEDA